MRRERERHREEARREREEVRREREGGGEKGRPEGER